MTKKKLIRAISLVLCGAVGAACIPSLAGCVSHKDSIVIMTEELSGLFNPFYATSGTDMDVVGMTQISMLSTDNNGDPVANDDLPTVVKAFSQEHKGDTTVYSFVIKNGIKFSDGKPLTMNDVLFNMYEYLDPVYTGSSTMYSIDIVGLSSYRTQKNMSSGSSGTENQISDQALAYARVRRNELYRLYTTKAKVSPTSTSYSATVAQMEGYINEAAITSGYKDAVATKAQQATMSDADYRAKLLEDYQLTLKTFKEELEADFKAAKESYDLESLPYSKWKNELSNDLFKFFLYENYITPVYNKVNGRDDKTDIVKFENTSIATRYNNEEDAINHVYNDKIVSNLHEILTAWGTAGTLITQYTADATEVLIKENMGGDGSTLNIPNIEGIKSLGHPRAKGSDPVVNNVKIDGVTYNVAHQHNEDGTPANQDEYDVLQVTINGVDPKAIYNFGFSVAPVHYYTADADHPDGREVDIVNDKFGVEYASSSFQSRVIQSQQHVEVPVGAGPYQATNADNDTNPSGASFWSSNIVYYKANEHFASLGEKFEVKTEKIRMQVVSSSNALDVLQSKAVDYVVPQFTMANANRLDQMKSKGFAQLDSWQLGYGYIGINAGKVPNLGVRKAIMAAMQTSLAVEYYKTGTCETISWPMSNISWAYPKTANGTSKPNGHDYAQWDDKKNEATGKMETTEAVKKIRKYAAGVSADQLKITFTIAGASITEHPTYEVFKQAAEILNNECGDMGWNVEVKADSQALTKLATGSLAVWAAAWGSTIDPDMYQVYHRNSNATSVYAWGYREIKNASSTTYRTEWNTIKLLSDKIDEGRATLDQNRRKTIYETAMGYVLDLAVELPVYQRKNLYAYNAKTVKGFPTEVNAYSSPLEKIWELELIG